MRLTPATLYVVATPIGNTADITDRARHVLTSADVICAEDTRNTGLVLQRLGIERTGQFVSLHEHNEAARVEQVLARLAEGQTVALVSDAGTPLMSDPGFRLVRAAREAGHTVVPVPGACAATAALMACGLPPQPYVFIGFLPRKKGEVARLLADYARLPATLVFYERASRLPATLDLLAASLGPREAVVARELTKTHEQFVDVVLGQSLPESVPLKGEVTLVVAPPASGEDTPPPDESDVQAVLDEELTAGGKPRQVAKRVAARLGLPVDQCYRLLQERD